MTRALARQQLLAAARERGRQLGASGQPFPQNSPAWITQRLALGVGLGTLSNTVLNGWAREVYDAYQSAWATAHTLLADRAAVRHG